MSGKVIRASEIAEYVYCHRAWWLKRAAGHTPEETQELAAGSQYHQAHGAVVFQATLTRRVAYGLLILAVFMGLVWIVQAF
ncbi:MAG: hypothetical protein AB1791_23190 [Chloroflexota bacterium]